MKRSGHAVGRVPGFLAAALLILAAGEASAEDVERLTGTKGSWAVLLTEDSEPLGAWYWLGPEAIVGFPEASIVAVGIGPNQIVVQDRGLMPTRAVSSMLFDTSGAAYYRNPPTYSEMDRPLPVGGTVFKISPYVWEHRSIRSIDMTLRWTGAETREFPRGEVAAWRYESSQLVALRDYTYGPSTGIEQRVYLPEYDIDLDAGTWAEVRDVVHGAGFTASPQLVMHVAALANPAAASCLDDLAREPSWEAYLEGFAALEDRTNRLLPIGTTDLLVSGFRDYQALDPDGTISNRFRSCLRDGAR